MSYKRCADKTIFFYLYRWFDPDQGSRIFYQGLDNVMFSLVSLLLITLGGMIKDDVDAQTVNNELSLTKIKEYRT